MPGAEAILSTLMERDPSALLVDIRSQPYSKRPEWRHDSLALRFGQRYRPLGELLGNVNYNNGRPMMLAASTLGVKRLISWLEAGHSLILLCACRDYARCHRSLVVAKVRRVCPEIEVEEAENMRFNEWRPTPGQLPALSVSQPWAWLLASGLKTIENRSWITRYRGPLLLHTGKSVDRAAFDGENLFTPTFYKMTDRLETVYAMPKRRDDYPTGGIVGIATLVDVVKQSENPWFVGPYGLVLKDARPLPFVPYRGQLGLFGVPESIATGEYYDAELLVSEDAQQVSKAASSPARRFPFWQLPNAPVSVTIKKKTYAARVLEYTPADRNGDLCRLELIETYQDWNGAGKESTRIHPELVPSHQLLRRVEAKSTDVEKKEGQVTQ
jgi:hypothetical protein